ncbi:hypothetical protein ACFSX9_03030 [Flavobacterium ardleyense]|uniref:Uncharacterized protein n=1 Tax=Flavobacterium ardleyense TaxID=2038737 RepID=A0ABW5Z6D3_9FLAO
MKTLFSFFLIITSFFTVAQVGIGTTTPSPSSILELQSTTQTFVPPRMTGAEMNAITAPLNGSIVYNTTEDAMYIKTSAGWQSMFFVNNDVLLLNKEFSEGNMALATGNDSYYNLPINNADVLQIEPLTYTVIGNGTIKILKSGVYSIVAGLSTSNLPAGNAKYIIAVYKNGNLYNYLARGVANNSSTDEFGFSGSTGITVISGDVLNIQYVLNNGGTPLNAKYINIGITRLK